MNSIQKEVVNWHSDTFPNATTHAIQDKLKEEAQELIDALNTMPLDARDISLEVADVIIAASALFNRWDIDLDQVVLNKLAVNRERAWGKELPNGDRPREKSC